MTKTTWLIIFIIVAAAAIGLIIWAIADRAAEPPGASPSISSSPSGVTINLASKSGLGDFLVDKDGMTLYYFANDNLDKSNCLAAQCLALWPIYYEENLVVPSSLDKNNFGEITRQDGRKQTTYKGWPLYYYAPDNNPGDTLGEAFNNIWFVVTEPFYNVMLQNQPGSPGNHLTDAKAMSLYYFANDRQGTAVVAPQSNCTGQCLAAWPVFSVSNVIAPSLLKKSDFTALQRPDGASQLVYKGRPLYYFAQDDNPGDIKGHGFNNLWFLVQP